jgi:hypothetical protein
MSPHDLSKVCNDSSSFVTKRHAWEENGKMNEIYLVHICGKIRQEAIASQNLTTNCIFFSNKNAYE